MDILFSVELVGLLIVPGARALELVDNLEASHTAANCGEVVISRRRRVYTPFATIFHACYITQSLLRPHTPNVPGTAASEIILIAIYAPAVEIFSVGVGVALKVVAIGHDQGGELGLDSLPKGCKRSVRKASAQPKRRAGPGEGPKVRKAPLPVHVPRGGRGPRTFLRSVRWL